MTELDRAGGFLPGETIELSFSFEHEMLIDQVVAVFASQGNRSWSIILSGAPELENETRISPDTISFRSAVTVYGEIEPGDQPGLYRCSEIFVLTKGGQQTAFEDTPELGFLVVEEPRTPPRFSGRFRVDPY